MVGSDFGHGCIRVTLSGYAKVTGTRPKCIAPLGALSLLLHAGVVASTISVFFFTHTVDCLRDWIQLNPRSFSLSGVRRRGTCSLLIVSTRRCVLWLLDTDVSAILVIFRKGLYDTVSIGVGEDVPARFPSVECVYTLSWAWVAEDGCVRATFS